MVISWSPHWIEGIVTQLKEKKHFQDKVKDWNPTSISNLKLFWVLELLSHIYPFISKIKMYYLHPRFPGSIPKFKPQKQQQQQQITHTQKKTLSQEHVSES